VSDHPLHDLFERLFGEDIDESVRNDGNGKWSLTKHRLSTDLDAARTPPRTMDGTSEDAALIASYLDGELESPRLAEFHARLADDPSFFEEVSAAESFATAMEASRSTVPPVLIASALAAVSGNGVRANPAGRKPIRWTWAAIAFAMATAAIITILTLAPRHAPTDPNAAMTAGNAPKVDSAIEPKKSDTPALAGEKRIPDGMLPASSEEKMPTQGKAWNAPIGAADSTAMPERSR
jgi:hypothetical protein